MVHPHVVFNENFDAKVENKNPPTYFFHIRNRHFRNCDFENFHPKKSMLHGVLLIALFACAAFYIGDIDWMKTLSFSPMAVGIIIGMLYADRLRNNQLDTFLLTMAMAVQGAETSFDKF